ncbi:hypothetical protein PUNSTDRAFT_66632 [Punctularia strigosozonata HHB-11173 SS5]|uniref:uncharacterized protein n=1 Tax=Punctularia strigosozonata (strain HHB-11173) TaxID=741275 RepID=UPI0004417B1A|nr:uncharacterized protein PUNSTDRAFT_66632 [Punctularia strigosozonata HHB-11173 SS5]EIN09521.1 hypothetical protein PUNSTDRAFT_66632 [Punctularia strigosozonata HHB-11173 SS5]
MERTPSGGFSTTNGTLYVSKPFRSRTSKKMRAMVSFAPRKSAFDIQNEQSITNEFRGFFTLFWISIFILAVGAYVRSFERSGYFLELAFARLMSRNAVSLAISDAVLVLSTGFCVPFAKAVSKGWIRYYWFGVVIQHVFQTFLLAVTVTWTSNQHWPWVQSGFLTLHTLVMIMKMHSYMSTNGYLSYAHAHAQQLLAQLQKAANAQGGWQKALSDAKANSPEAHDEKEKEGELTPSVSNTASSPAVGTPAVPTGADVSTSYIDADAASTLRQRLVAATNAAQKAGTNEESASKLVSEAAAAVKPSPGDTVMSAHPPAISTDSDSPRAPTPHPLVHHPDPTIADLVREYSELESELTSMGPKYVRWPENITWKDFAVYQLIPTLVYELEYPRTDKIRPLYVFEKTVATFGTFALLYTVTEAFILPLTPTPDQSFPKSLLDLALPFMIAYLLLFYLIFECICNAFAELSYFADRQFYEDWWNSTSWDEFSRKWNKPVHTFLLRHVYASSISTYRISRGSAMFLTFLLSAAVHELVMVIVTHKIRMYLFVMQLAQIPLIFIGRIPAIKQNKLLGNIVFWIGLYAGFPLLCVAYCAY